MQVFLIIILIAVLIWLLFGKRIQAWIQRAMMRRMEDMIRRSMGMPTAKEEARMHRQRQKDGTYNKSGNRRQGYGHHGPETVHPDTIIPKEYAEDVEFVEYKDYSSASSTTTLSDSDGSSSTRFKVEEQVSDVEFVEIKK